MWNMCVLQLAWSLDITSDWNHLVGVEVLMANVVGSNIGECDLW